MLFYVFLFPVLLMTTSVFSLVQIETKHAKPSVPSPTFTNDTVIDVIRNISKVNNDLQELIKNYEQLQKTYKTETFESGDDYLTDSEIDEPYGDKKRKKKNKAKVTTDALVSGFPATQFTAFEDTFESSVTDGDSVERAKGESSTTDANSHNRLPTIEILYDRSSPSKNEIKSDSTVTSLSDEVTKKGKAPMHTTFTKKPPKIFFLDTHKLLNNIYSSTHRSQTNPEPIRMHENDTTPRQKTRYKKVNHRSDHRKKMWDVISKYKPNEQNKGSENIAKEENTHRNGAKDLQLSFNKTAWIRNQETKNKYSDSAAEEKEMNKEMFKTLLLRKEYDDTCTKLVVRKCFKACKLAVKRACVSARCKASFKESFKLHSRTGCLRQFDASQNQTTTTIISIKPLRTGGINFRNDDSCLAAACWPLPSTGKIPAPLPQSVKTYEPTRSQNESQAAARAEGGLVFLRSQMKKVCDKCSRRKCRKACLYAYGQTCSTFHCAPRRRAGLRSRCRRECQRAFPPRSQDATSGSRDSSSFSDTSDSSSFSDTSDSSSFSDSSD